MPKGKHQEFDSALMKLIGIQLYLQRTRLGLTQ
jgi:hypothetical protein